MKLKDIAEFIENKIPSSLALDFDSIGFKKEYDLNQNIVRIKIYMDLLPEDDNEKANTLIITHHPPVFVPKTPTFTIHSNWDIIDGGANEALADKLHLEVTDYFDKKTNIGRICKSDYTFGEVKKIIRDNFNDACIVNSPQDETEIKKIGIVSGFGLKNREYIQLAYDNELDLLISGDLCQETAILAKYLGVTLIDLGHHDSEVPGLYRLAEIFKETDVDCEVIDKKPFEKL